MFIFGYGCEEKHMMWVMFYSVLFSFISLFSVLNWYYRQSHIQHLSLVGLPTTYFDNVGKPFALGAQQRIALSLLPVFTIGKFPSSPLYMLFNYNFPASQKSLFLPELGSPFTANTEWKKFSGQDFSQRQQVCFQKDIFNCNWQLWNHCRPFKV